MAATGMWPGVAAEVLCVPMPLLIFFSRFGRLYLAVGIFRSRKIFLKGTNQGRHQTPGDSERGYTTGRYFNFGPARGRFPRCYQVTKVQREIPRGMIHQD